MARLPCFGPRPLRALALFALVPLLLAPRLAAGEPASFRRGDANADGRYDLSDPVSGLIYLFLGGTRPSCLDAADANDDGGLNLSDALYSLNYLFLGGREPPPPGLACGDDGTEDTLDCAAFEPCAIAPIEPMPR